jgi:hypothetical protein
MDPAYGYAGAAYQPRRRRTGLFITVLVLLFAAVTTGTVFGAGALLRSLNDGGTTGSPVPPTSRPATNPTTTAPRPTTPPPTTTQPATGGFDGDLRELLVPRPSGANPWAEPPDEDGALDIDEAADLFRDEGAMKNDLESLNFRRGAVMHWNDDGLDVLIILFQFEEDDGAQGYVSSTSRSGIEGYEDRGSFGGIGNSLLFVDDTPNNNGQRSSIFISSAGDIVSYLTVWRVGNVNMDEATALAVNQHERLP